MNDAEFERWLRESLRHVASKAEPPETGFDVLLSDPDSGGEIRTGLPDAAHRYPPPRRELRQRPRRRWIVEGLGVAAVLAVIAVVLVSTMIVRHDRPRRQPGLAGPTWAVSVGVIQGAGAPRYGPAFTVPARRPVVLEVTVAPRHPNGKTYLERSIEGGAWVRIGPHNTDGTSREWLRVTAPMPGQRVAYRVNVVAAAGHGSSWSDPVVFTGT
jgi:hypothetical protein